MLGHRQLIRLFAYWRVEMHWITTNTRLLLTLILVAFLVLPVYYLSGKLVLNISPSLDRRALWLSPGEIQLGDYVVFDYSHPIIAEVGLTRMSKRIGCFYPQVISVSARDVFCDDKRLGTALFVDKNGNPMPITTDTGEVPQGKAFVVGDHERSFDSRYYGLIDVARMTRAVPLFP